MIEFDDYWRQVCVEHRAFIAHGGADCEKIARDQIVTAHGFRWCVDWLRYSSVGDTVIYGWVATPADHAANGEGLVWLPGYSYGTPPADASNLVPGATTVCINVHGKPPDKPYVNPVGKDDYITRGWETPQSYIMRQIALHCLICVDVTARVERINPKKIAVGGMSQGGALAMITATYQPLVRLCFADMPFLCSVRSAIEWSQSPLYRFLRQKLDESGDTAGELLNTLALFDPIYHAERLRVPIHLTAGGRDPSSRLETIEPVYQKIGASVKAFRCYPDAGHIFVSEMPEIYRDWMSFTFAKL